MKLYTVSHQGRTLVCRAEDGALRYAYEKPLIDIK